MKKQTKVRSASDTKGMKRPRNPSSKKEVGLPKELILGSEAEVGEIDAAETEFVEVGALLMETHAARRELEVVDCP